jgi:hypothetical protein
VFSESAKTCVNSFAREMKININMTSQDSACIIKARQKIKCSEP